MTIPELIKELERIAEIALEQGYDPKHVNVLFSWRNCPEGTAAEVNVADFERLDNEAPEVILKF